MSELRASPLDRLMQAHGQRLLTAAVICSGVVAGLAAAEEPVLAAVAAGAGLLGLIALLRPELATYTVLFLLYSNIAVVAVRYHGAPGFLPVLALALLGVPLVQELFLRRRGFAGHPALPLLLLFLAVSVLGVMYARDAAAAAETLTEYALEGLVLYFLVINVVRTPEALRGATWALLAAGLAVSAVPIYQQLTGSFDSIFGGFGQTTDVGFRTGEVTVAGEVRQVRLSGTIGEQNRFAQNMMMLVPLGLMRYFDERSKPLRALALLCTAAATLACMLTFSRGAAVAFVILLAAMVVLRVLRPRHLAVLAVAGAVALAAMPHYWSRLATLTEVGGLLSDGGATREVDSSFRGRATEMLAAAQVFVDHPVVGVGPGMFKHYSREYGNRLGIRRLEQGRQAHSLYLGLAAENGALGLACFFGAVGVTALGLLEVRRRRAADRPDLARAATGWLLVLVAYLATGLFMHLSYIRFFFLMLALAGAAALIGGAHAAGNGDSPEAEKAP